MIQSAKFTSNATSIAHLRILVLEDLSNQAYTHERSKGNKSSSGQFEPIQGCALHAPCIHDKHKKKPSLGLSQRRLYSIRVTKQKVILKMRAVD